jgi:hypothetical protein
VALQVAEVLAAVVLPQVEECPAVVALAVAEFNAAVVAVRLQAGVSAEAEVEVPRVAARQAVAGCSEEEAEVLPAAEVCNVAVVVTPADRETMVDRGILADRETAAEVVEAT